MIRNVSVFLKQANYYRLSAYFLPFRKKNGTYFADISFNRIQRIYKFDSKLRGVLFNCIERIELHLSNTTCLLLWTCLWIFGVHG